MNATEEQAKAVVKKKNRVRGTIVVCLFLCMKKLCLYLLTDTFIL